MKKVVVLGGGVAGLTIAFRRGAAGETVVLEASPRAGGSIRTIREDGFTLEGGPNTLRTTEAADRLVADLGLEPAVVLADGAAPRGIGRGGAPRAIVPGPMGLFNTVFTTAAKLRLLGDRFVPPRPASLDDETVDSFFRRRFGAEAARYGAGPMVSGVYAGDPAALSIRSAFPHLWEAERRSGSVIKDFLAGGMSFKRAPDGGKLPKPRHRPRTLTFTRGLEEMTEALVRKMPASARVVMGAGAVAVEGPRPTSAAGSRWTVMTADGRSFDADVLVSTLAAPALARLLGERLPRSGSLLAAVPSSPVSVVILAFRAVDSTAAPRGFGALIPRGEGFDTLGVLYPASLFTGRAPAGWALTTSFIGGAVGRAAAALPDAELLAHASGEVARLHPRLGRPERSWIVRWPEAIPQMPLGHWRTMAALENDLAALEGVAGAPGVLVVTGGFRDGIALGERIARGEAIGRELAV